MAKISSEMKEVTEKAKGWALATASKDGTPHIIPVGFAKVLSDSEILVMDCFMTKTTKNIEANPKVAISAWDYDSLKGYRFEGVPTIHTSGPVFDDGAKWVKEVMPQLSARAAIVVKVEKVYNTSPGPDAGKEIS